MREHTPHTGAVGDIWLPALLADWAGEFKPTAVYSFVTVSHLCPRSIAAAAASEAGGTDLMHASERANPGFANECADGEMSIFLSHSFVLPFST